MNREADLSDETPPETPDLEDLALDEDYALNAAFVDMVIDAADRGDGARLRDLVEALRPADVADAGEVIKIDGPLVARCGRLRLDRNAGNQHDDGDSDGYRQSERKLNLL